MYKTKLRYNPEEAKAVFKRYVAFEKEKMFRKIPVKLIYASLIVLMCIGFLSHIPVMMYGALGASVVVSGFLLFYQIKFTRYLQLISKEIDKNTSLHNQAYTFSFDEVEMIKDFPSFSDRTKWETIKSYEVNVDDVYLYREKKRLYDIVSKSLIGEENFAHFFDILEKEFHQ